MDLLNLPHLKVVEVKENEFDYGIHVETTIEGEPHCPQCGFTDLYKHGTLKQMFWDIPLHAKRTGLFFKRQRYKCKQCSSTFMEPIPNMDEKRTMTSRLVEYIERQSLKETFTKLAEQVGCDEKTIRNVFNEFVERMEKKHEVSTPKWIGVDEIHLNKKMRFVITDIENRLLLDVVRERDKLMPQKALSKLKDKDRIEVVTMDMWRPYKDAANIVIPQAKVVVDKFHVVKNANKGIENARIAVRKELTRRIGKQLFHDRAILRKRKKNLSEMELFVLEIWTKNVPIIGMAYEFKERLFEVYDAEDFTEAYKRYRSWQDEFPKEIRPYFKDLLSNLKNWEEEIFNYFTNHRLTNAYTESLNGLIKVCYRMGRGYSFEALRAKMLFTEGVRKFDKPSFDKTDLMPKRLIYAPLPKIDWANFGKEELPVDMGADISTIIRLFEEGLL